jgi:ABC-type glycerol-3-phosphate transport system substrate-binding protein
VEVRVKNGNILKALTTTQAAAPTIMPDIVALSREDLEAVAGAGLLHPLDGLSTLPDDPDWYPYARQIAHVKNTAFGLPFAGDALALVGYTTSLPTSWNELPEGTLFVFPAADPQALFTLSLYLSVGGTLVDDQGLPFMDEAILAEVLSLYVPPEEDEVGFVSPLVTEYQTNEQSWNAFLEQRGNLSSGWVSTYLQTEPANVELAALPGLDAGQYTLGTGWSWALSGLNLDNQPLAMELAEFLTDSTFLAEWNQATGYLPTRPTALMSREDAVLQLGLSQTAESANLIPSQELLTVVGPLVSQAVQSVVNGEKLPAEAVQTLSEELR